MIGYTHSTRATLDIAKGISKQPTNIHKSGGNKRQRSQTTHEKIGSSLNGLHLSLTRHSRVKSQRSEPDALVLGRDDEALVGRSNGVVSASEAATATETTATAEATSITEAPSASAEATTATEAATATSVTAEATTATEAATATSVTA